jgi:hypothetical protein
MDKLTNIKETSANFINQNKKYVIIGAIVLVLFIFYFWKRRQARKNSPTFFANGTDAKKQQVILDEMILQNKNSVQMTYQMFLYVDNWDYNMFWFKPIIMKSASLNQFCPLMYLEPVVNNLVAVITTEKGINHVIRVEDFPIKRWTHVALCIRETNVDLYIGGLMARTRNLDSPAKQNAGNLQVCPMGGFSGFLSKLSYTAEALSSRQIFDNSRMPIFSIQFFSVKVINTDIGSRSTKKPSEADLTAVSSDSLVVFAAVPNSLSPLKAYDAKLFDRMNNRMANAAMGRNSIVSNGDNCPTEDDAPFCPVGTLACFSNQRYCYYPDRDIMVSTYMRPEEDYCPAKQTGKVGGNMPFEIAGVPVWKRQQGKDGINCSNIK